MLKSFFEYIIGLGNTRIEEIDGVKYATQPINRIKQYTASALVVHNLTGIVDYLRSNYDNQPPALIHIESPTEVHVISTFNCDYQRHALLTAKALLPNIQFEKFLDVERFNVMLQSSFCPNDHRAALLRLVGNVREEAVRTVGDDGISQSVVARSGVATVEPVTAPNPVKLMPFRTFTECEQPESEFVFRLQDGPASALFEADGGAWKSVAIARIKMFLLNELDKEVREDKVTIIA